MDADYPENGVSIPCRSTKFNFALTSCQHFEQGYFTPYAHLADEDIYLILHLGDYIYESDSQTARVRQHNGPEPTDLVSYRRRYAQYKSDPFLQRAHALYPWVNIWDDHEIDNDYAGAFSEEHDPPTTFLHRRNAAYRAFFEHLPVRKFSQRPEWHNEIFKKIDIGPLASFYFLDVRKYRTDQPCGTSEQGGGRIVSSCAERLSENATMLGDFQEQWLSRSLSQTNAKWNFVVQPLLMSQLDELPGPKQAFWTDAWDGYVASRKRMLGYFREYDVSNPIIFGGDIHSYWVNELKMDFDDPDAKTIAPEIIATSISSDGVPFDTFSRFLPDNLHVKYFESRKRGYALCELQNEKLDIHFRSVDTVLTLNSSIETTASFCIKDNIPSAERTS